MEVSLLSQQEEKFALFVEGVLRHGKDLSRNDIGSDQQDAAHGNFGDKQQGTTRSIYGNIDSQNEAMYSNYGVIQEAPENNYGNSQKEAYVPESKDIVLDLSKKSCEKRTIEDIENDKNNILIRKSGSFINVKEALLKKICKDREKRYGALNHCSMVDEDGYEHPQEPVKDHSYISVSQSNGVDDDLKETNDLMKKDTHNIFSDIKQGLDDGSSHTVQNIDDTPKNSVQKMEDSSLDHEQDGHDGSLDNMQDSPKVESMVRQEEPVEHNLQNLNQQLKKKRGQMHYKCNICGYGTNSYKLHKKHKSTHKEPQHITRAVTQSSRQEEAVKKKQTEEKKKKTTGNRTIKSKPVVPEKKLKCDKCQFRTDSSENLKRHMTVHQSTDSFVCGICDFKCRTKTGLGRHLKKHREEMPWICQECDFQAHDEFSLDLHMKLHSAEETEESNVKGKLGKVTKKQRYKCDVCDFSTTHEETFQKHWGKHTGEKFYKCDECIFGTNNKSVFLSHQRLHMGVKPFQCQTCGSRFTQMRGLKTHQNSNLCTPASGQKAVNQTVKITKNHAKEVEWAKAMVSKKKVNVSSESSVMKRGIYKCNQCEFSTNRPSHLSRHLIIHLDYKPFKCDLCDYRANFKINLTTHMRIHSGEKPNKCDYCPYSTYREDHLRRHLATHKDIKRYHCNLCTYSTVSEDQLEKHSKKHSEVTVNDDGDNTEVCET